MVSNYSTEYILKLYIFMNLIFLLLLLSHDLTFYLLFIELVTLYFGLNTIYCMLEGNCLSQVLWIFSLYFFIHLSTFLLLKGYFPKTMAKVKKIEKIIKSNISK